MYIDVVTKMVTKFLLAFAHYGLQPIPQEVSPTEQPISHNSATESHHHAFLADVSEDSATVVRIPVSLPRTVQPVL